MQIKVLIIDDDPADREIFKHYLGRDEGEGFCLAEEATGTAGLARIALFQPDCILLDYDLPDIGGFDLIRQLKGEGAGSPAVAVVMTTAIGNEQLAVEAMKLGVMDYVVKGTAGCEALPRAVVNAVQRFRMEAEIAQHNSELETIRAELFEEKERYRTLTEAIPQLVWTADAQGRVEYANSRLREFSGQAGDVWHLSELVSEEDRAAFDLQWWLAPDTGAAFIAEVRLKRHDGVYRWHLVRAVPNRSSDHETVKWFGTLTDIEDQKRAEEALRQSQKLESLAVLAGGIAHDFNNLLTGIMGGASFVSDSLAPGPARSMLDVVVRSSERAAHLVQQLLAYAGKGSAELEAVDLGRIALDTTDLVRASFSRQLHFTADSATGLPPVRGNVAQVQQIVLNLVVNAAEAIGDRAGSVTVMTGLESLDTGNAAANILGYAPKPGDYVRLEVCDTGAGMDVVTLARIFDPFFTTKFAGRGLGLAALQGIVRSMEGAIQVRSVPGEGSTFRVLLPAMEGLCVAGSQRVPSDQSSMPTAILLIDDDEGVRKVAAASLRRHGHEVFTARSGTEGLGKFQEQQAVLGLVMLDLGMADMAGDRVLRELRVLSPDLPVVILSGYAERDIASRFAGLNVKRFLAKPFTVEALEDTVEEVLSGKG